MDSFLISMFLWLFAYALISGLGIVIFWNRRLTKTIKQYGSTKKNHWRELEQQYNHLTNILPVGMFRSDANLENTYVNEQCCQILGLALDEIVEGDWFPYLHADDVDRVIHQWSKVMGENSPLTIEFRFRRPDGKIIWLCGQCSPEQDSSGKFLGYMGIVTNISKQAEVGLLRSKRRFRHAVESAPFPIMIHAEDGEVLQINSMWSKLTGYQYTDIPTIKSWTKLAYGKDQRQVQAGINQLYSLTHRQEEGEFTIITKNGNFDFGLQNTRLWQVAKKFSQIFD